MRAAISASAMLAIASAPAFASAVAFTSEPAFLDAATPTHFENFDDEPAGSCAMSVSTSYFNVTITPLSGTLTGVVVGNSIGWFGETNYLGGGCPSGSNNPWRLDFVMNFPVYAVGFNVESASEAPTQGGGTSVVRLDLPGGEQFVMSSCPPCYPPGGAVYFFGFVSDTPLTAFSIVNTAYSDGVGFDRFQFAAVPIPAAAWLLGSALAVLGWCRRKIAA